MAGDPPTIGKSEIVPPPKPAEVRRRIRMTFLQVCVLGVFGLIIGLALFDVLGANRDRVGAQSDALEMIVDYPTRMRYKRIDPMRVFVRNTSTQVIDTLTVSFDPSYIDKFSNVAFIPSASRVWAVNLTNVQPGETRRIQVGLQGEQYGFHTGEIAAFFAGSDTVAVEVGTFTFP